ncbi:hypothetical protein B566_EDAN002554, partial [Ephemera danica]
EGTIGSDFVVRPVPSNIRHLAPPPPPHEDDEDPNDDEMFLDEEPGQEEAVSSGFPLPPEKPRKSAAIKKASQQTLEKKQSGAKSRVKRSAASVGMHVVIKRAEHVATTEDPLSDYAFMEPDHISKRFKRRAVRRSSSSSRQRRQGREAPYVIYPEILVIVDYDGYRLHGGDNVQIKRYFVSFWNGVDLRYKLLKGPKVRISIAGIIISRGRDATPYLERNRVGRDAIDSAAALTDMGKYLFRERRLPVYDIAVAITKYDMCRRRKGGRCTKGTAGMLLSAPDVHQQLDMCRRQYANDACNRGTAGFAYVGGACVVNKRLEKVNSVAIIEDTGGFSGIIVAAHEVGHLLGAVHDGSPPPSYLGGPGAEKCRWEDGFIMSDLRHTEKGFRWSPCSVTSFHHFLNGETATCLFNAPHEDDALPRVLPGKLLSLDAQCRKDRGTSACFKDERVCAQLFCFDANSGYCVAYRPAAEGSPCGDGQSCLNGRCVAEHENIIPDYTQITPAYARPENQPAATQAHPVYVEPPSRNISTTRSQPPWGNLWSGTKSTTYNYYQTTTPLSTAYQYTSPSTTTVYRYPSTSPPSSSTYNWYNRYTSTTTTTTTTRPPIQQESTTSTYVYFSTKPSSTKSYTSFYNPSSTKTFASYYNPYKNQNNYFGDYSSTTSSTPNPYYTKVNPFTQPAVSPGAGDNEASCEDHQTKFSTNMSCTDLLTRYPEQYCRSYYIKKYCCASMQRMCPNPAQQS